MGDKKKTVATMRKIFILHGWTYSTDKWPPLIKLMGGKGIEPVLLNIPGLTTEGSSKVWTLDDYVEWLKRKLETEKELPVLIGHSNGGRIAIAFASKYPNKLKQLILIDSAGIYHNELPLCFKRLLFGSIAKLGKKITHSGKLRDLLYKIAGESDYKNATAQMRKTMTNLISTDLTSELSKITVPTLIIWGKLDELTPVSDGKLMHSHIKNSKIYIIEDAGHSPHFTRTQEVLEKIIAGIKL